MSDSKHIVIIGGGIMGLSSAYYLAQRGYQITIIDRGAPGTANCSFGNAGYVTPSHVVPLASPGMVMMGLKWMRDPESPFYVRPRLATDLLSWGWRFYRAGTKAHVERSAPLLYQLNMASRACFEAWDDELGQSFSFEKKGMMLLCKSQHALDEEAEVAHLAQSLGLRVEVLDAKQTQERNPNVKLDACGAVYYADDCHMAPQKLMARLQAKLEAQNVTFRWNTEVTGWNHNEQRIKAVVTSEGEVNGDEFVLCGGSWSTVTARGLGLKIPIQAGKGYNLTLPQPHSRPAVPMIFVERRVAVTPMGDQLRFAGTMEIAGLNTDINPARIRGIKKSVPLYFPEFSDADFKDVQPWVGLRPCTPDGLPYVGRTRRYDNLCIATGHAMVGLSLGPITGQIIAQTIAGETPPFAMAQLDPDRYG
jgi:D-amino-acid dehydrogenase